MAKSSHIVSALLLLLLSSLTAAFQVAPFSPSLAARGTASTSPTSLHVFGNKKPSSASAQDALLERARRAGVSGGFWEGEWVCKDCGYIYNRAECAGLFFEEQGPGFRCPQCSGPRRRYAKKVGDRVGTTLDGGDAPILIFSFGGVIATIIFGFWAANNL